VLIPLFDLYQQLQRSIYHTLPILHMCPCFQSGECQGSKDSHSSDKCVWAEDGLLLAMRRYCRRLSAPAILGRCWLSCKCWSCKCQSPSTYKSHAFWHLGTPHSKKNHPIRDHHKFADSPRACHRNTVKSLRRACPQSTPAPPAQHEQVRAFLRMSVPAKSIGLSYNHP